MVFHPNEKDIATLVFNGIDIERVSEFKNGGAIIDEKLSGKSIWIKISKHAGILN